MEQKKSLEEVNIALISNGKPHFIVPFRKETGYEGPIYTDPSLETYKLLNFRHGLLTHMGAKSLTESIRAATQGHAKLLVQGDPNQQGGVIVISPQDQVDYYYRNKETGDHAPMDQVLKAYFG